MRPLGKKKIKFILSDDNEIHNGEICGYKYEASINDFLYAVAMPNFKENALTINEIIEHGFEVDDSMNRKEINYVYISKYQIL